MTTFIALYRGNTVADAKIICVSAEPGLVADVVNRLIVERSDDGRASVGTHGNDPVLDALERGRTAALRLIAGRSAEKVGTSAKGGAA